MNLNDVKATFKLSGDNFLEFIEALKNNSIERKPSVRPARAGSLRMKSNGRINTLVKAQLLEKESEEQIKTPKFLLGQVSSLEKCGCLYKLFCCNLCSKKGNHLDDIEESDILAYERFKKDAIDYYYREESSNENSLRFLYMQTLNCDLTQDLTNEKWKTIGFLSTDPREDLLIGGYYSLLFINYFINHYEDESAEVMKTKHFSFGMISILDCFFLKLALDIFEDDVYSENLRKKIKIKAVTINQFTNFCRKYNYNHYYPHELMTNILLSAHEEISKKETCDLYTSFLILKTSFDTVFYKELDVPFEYVERVSDWSVG